MPMVGGICHNAMFGLVMTYDPAKPLDGKVL